MLCTRGDVGGSGSRGTSAALLMARKDSSSEAVTRDAEVHRGRRRMLCGCSGTVWKSEMAVLFERARPSMTPFTRTPVAPAMHVQRSGSIPTVMDAAAVKPC